MKKNILVYAFTFLSTIFSVAYAQTDLEYDSKKIIEKGVALHDEKKYDEAIAEYKKVNKNDTNYVLAQIELVFSYYQSDRDSLVVVVCNDVLQTPSKYSPSALLYKADALDKMKKYDEAIKAFEEGIKRYPMNNSFYYDYALLKYNQGKYKDAYDLCVKSLGYNPYHANSHNLMGNLAIKQGKIIPAILAFQFYLLLDNTSTRAAGIVNQIESLCKIEYEFKDAVKVDELADYDNFEELESILRSKAALSGKYKSQTKLNYAVTKQLQLISEKIAVDKNDKGFYMQFYAPILAEQYKKGYLEPYSYSLFSGLNNEEIDKWIKRNEKSTNEWASWLKTYIGDHYTSFDANLNGKTIKARHWYSNSFKINAVGNVDAAGTDIGYWNYYYSNGILKTEGGYDNKGQRDGVWKYYDMTGTLKDIERYTGGKLTGKRESFYSNGSIKSLYNDVNGLFEGVQTTYYPTGVKKGEYDYKAGIEEGKERSFHRNGKLEYEMTVVNEKFEGDFLKYYENGHLREKSFFKAGKREGKSVNYYNVPANQVKSEGSYREGVYVGEWKFYHQNGQLDESGMLDKEGNRTGLWKSYYDDGVLKSEEMYSKGKNDGIIKYYSNNGKQNEEFVYKNGVLQEYKAFAPDGKIIYQNKKDGRNNYDLVLFHPNGNKRREGKIVNGLSEGVWKNYHFNGYITDEVKYTADKKDGKSIEYYPNGKIKSEMQYVNGETDGYYREYYKNGKLKREGAYVEDKSVGLWTGYEANGCKDYERFYKDDKLDGWQAYYSCAGKIDSEDNRELEYLKKTYIYDSLGKVFETINFDKGTANIDSKYFNGKPKARYTYKNNILQGKYESFYPNGGKNSVRMYENDDLQDEYLAYYTNGVLAYTKNYVNDEMHGKQSYYFKEGGNLRWEINYFYGKIVGTETYYYPNKQIEWTRTYKDGELDGVYIRYDEAGEVQLKRNFENGRFVSYTYLDATGNYVPLIMVKNETVNIKAFYKNGNPSMSYSLVNGDLEGKRIVYYSNGKVKEEDTYLNDDLLGTSKEYYVSGKIKAEDQYKDGNKNGKCVEYYENGKIKSVEYYVNDTQHGKSTYYDIDGKLTKTHIYYDGELVDEIL